MIEYTREVASQVAQAGLTVISGAAKGVDRTAMNAALETGGQVVGVLAGDLERTVMNREYRDLLVAERLVLLSPYEPSSGFNVGHAMQRNKVIYGLADAGLVVNAVVNRGGTWAGAVEQLRKYAVPVFVRSTGDPSEGLEALKVRGARPWPNPNSASGIKEVLRLDSAQDFRTMTGVLVRTQEHHEVASPDCSMDTGLPTNDVSPDRVNATTNYAEELYRMVRSWAPRICAQPKKPRRSQESWESASLQRMHGYSDSSKREHHREARQARRYVAPQQELFEHVPTQQG
ncbi:Protein Smf [Geodia barretti]|uniref:Protein Smf n=1 Tax=Geodia barretti TaxID=519541 RepID=A0AA35TEI9_GEOBA|nr:Protein Smf [Geodia barretti]